MVPERFGVALAAVAAAPQPQLPEATELISPRIPSPAGKTTTIETTGKTESATGSS